MLCPICVELRVEASPSLCSVCGAPLQSLTAGRLESIVQSRLEARLVSWRDQGLLDTATAARLTASLLEVPPAEEAIAVLAPVAEPSLEQKADAFAARLEQLKDWRPSWGKAFFQSMEDTARKEREARRHASRPGRRDLVDDEGLDLASDSGQALFHRVDASALGGLEAMAALDGDTPDTTPRLNEYVWWFLGALLVLGGSLMGVREAWRSLGGVPRQLLVTGALFGYHAAFVGLGVFLSRRSATVGRVLASIGVVLLPVVYVALSSLVAHAPGVGLAVATGLTGATLFSLRSTARLLYRASPLSISVALVPALVAGLPLLFLDEAPWLRTLCAFVGVAGLAASAWRIRKESSPQAGLATLATGLYGALALALFAVVGSPEGFAALAAEEPLRGGMTLWAMALASVMAAVAMRPGVREAHPQAAPTVEMIAHAAVASGVLASASVALALEPGAFVALDGLSALTPLVAALSYFVLSPGRPALVHAGVLSVAATSVLVARLVDPTEPRAWMVGLAVVSAGLLILARAVSPGSWRVRWLGWGIVLSLAALVLTSIDVVGGGSDTPWPVLEAGALVALSAHLVGGHRWRGLHYLGGLGAYLGALAGLDVLGLSGVESKLGLLGVLAALYAGAGLLQDLWMRRGRLPEELSPLDDVSLALAALGAVCSTLLLHVATEAPLGGLTALFLAGLLLLRARRDRTRLVSALGAWALAMGLWPAFLRFSPGGLLLDVHALHLASVALGFSVIAALRPRSTPSAVEEPWGRRLLGWLWLPFGGSGRALYTDGFAAVTLGATALTLLYLVEWMSVFTPAGRPLAVLSAALLAGSAALAFLSRGFVTWRLRGSVGTLGAMGAFIALMAVLHRLGRPLAPDVNALRMTCIGVGLWALAVATQRFGPALGRLLENERHGPLYAFVPFTGVTVLAGLLAVGPLRMDSGFWPRAMAVVPPLYPLGAGLLALLLAHSLRSRGLGQVALVLGLPGAALWAVQGSPLGIPLEAWPASGALPPVWDRAFLGIAFAAFVYSGARLGLQRLGTRHPFHVQLIDILSDWAGVAVRLVFLAAFLQPGAEAALLVFISGVQLLRSGASSRGRWVSGLGLLMIVHALAHRASHYPLWAGPVLALLGGLAVVMSPHLARWRKTDVEAARLRAQQGAFFFGLHATAYALATGGTPRPEQAMPGVLLTALIHAFEVTWRSSAALPMTSALLAATLFIGAAQWRGALTRLGTLWGTLLAGAALVTGLEVTLVALASDPQRVRSYLSLLSLHGPELAMGMAAVVGLAHGVNRWLSASRGEFALGLAWGRDVWMLTLGAWLAGMAGQGLALGASALPLTLASLGVAVGVALHAAWREHTGRHVYFVQVSVVGVYALVRMLYARELRAEHDALFALALGFALVGVTVLARRAGIPPVADATRRFAALLPLGMFLVLPSEATGEAALLAGGSGLLYAALGAVERSRWFGSLAAAACNAALLVAALAMGLEGLEIFLAPLGLLLLMISQLFTNSLPHAARNLVRAVGGMLLYVPAAAKLTLGLGLAEDGTYAVIFGAACLVGVMAGMVLRIRAYLALGTLFLSLDVAATLVHAGLRDHRIGFGVMTLTGLAIVGGRIFATLHRDWVDRTWQRTSLALKGWD